jgi:hypothetical protein
VNGSEECKDGRAMHEDVYSSQFVDVQGLVAANSADLKIQSSIHVRMHLYLVDKSIFHLSLDPCWFYEMSK